MCSISLDFFCVCYIDSVLLVSFARGYVCDVHRLELSNGKFGDLGLMDGFVSLLLDYIMEK